MPLRGRRGEDKGVWAWRRNGRKDEGKGCIMRPFFTITLIQLHIFILGLENNQYLSLVFLQLLS